MKGKQFSLAVCLVLLAGLVASMALNAVLYRAALAQYAEEQWVRLDPLGDRVLASRHAGVSAREAGRRRIVLTGDSRVEMWHPLPEVAGAEVLNSGRSGDTTKQVLLRLERDVVALEPDVVVLEAGINDLKALGLFPDLGPMLEAQCLEHLQTMAARLAGLGVEVVVLSVFPPGPIEWRRRPVWSDETAALIARVNAAMAAWELERVTVVDCSAALEENGVLRPGFARDAFHLTPEAYASLNRELEPVLRELCETKGRQG